MSVPAVAGAVEPEINKVPEKVVEKADEHTPDPAVPPAVAEHTPEPPRPDREGLAELRDVVAGLATSVNALIEVITAKTDPDESPHKRPWTHRGPRARDDR